MIGTQTGLNAYDTNPLSSTRVYDNQRFDYYPKKELPPRPLLSYLSSALSLALTLKIKPWQFFNQVFSGRQDACGYQAEPNTSPHQKANRLAQSPAKQSCIQNEFIIDERTIGTPKYNSKFLHQKSGLDIFESATFSNILLFLVTSLAVLVAGHQIVSSLNKGTLESLPELTQQIGPNIKLYQFSLDPTVFESASTRLELLTIVRSLIQDKIRSEQLPNSPHTYFQIIGSPTSNNKLLVEIYTLPAELRLHTTNIKTANTSTSVNIPNLDLKTAANLVHLESRFGDSLKALARQELLLPRSNSARSAEKTPRVK